MEGILLHSHLYLFVCDMLTSPINVKVVYVMLKCSKNDYILAEFPFN